MLLTLKDIYDAEIAKTSDGGTFDLLQGMVVDPGHLLTVQLVSVEDSNTDYTTLQVGIMCGSTFHGLLDQDAPAAGGIYYFRWRILVPADHRLSVKLIGCTLGDYIRMHVQGYLYELGV